MKGIALRLSPLLILSACYFTPPEMTELEYGEISNEEVDFSKLNNPCQNDIIETSGKYNASCLSCHGPNGSGMGGFPAINGKISLEGFTLAVRQGPSVMPSTPAASYSDAEIERDYYFLQKMNGCQGVDIAVDSPNQQQPPMEVPPMNVSDTTSPVLSLVTPPDGVKLAQGSKNLKVILSTNEDATCTYDNQASNVFDSTSKTLHEHQFTNLQDGMSYMHLIVCYDKAGNASNSITFTFSVAAAEMPPMNMTLYDGFQAVMSKYCLSCHAEFTDPGLLFNTQYKYVVKGKPNESNIYLSLTGSNGVKKMPVGGATVTATEMEAVRAWIASLEPDYVPPKDITPPIIISTAPNGSLMSGTTSVQLAVQTNEKSSCKYSNNATQIYDQMEAMSSGDQINHLINVSGLMNSEYTYYFLCRDLAGNESSKGFVNFKIGQIVDLDTAARNILKTNCMSCHGANVTYAGLDVTKDSSLFDVSKQFILKGDPAQSKIYQSLSGSNGISQMPPGGMLSENDKKIIHDWIQMIPKDQMSYTCDPKTDLFSPLTRRLTKKEIGSSFDTLFGRDFMPDLSSLPDDGKSRYGITRNGKSQGGYSPVAIEILYNSFSKEITEILDTKATSSFNCESQLGTSLNSCLNTNLIPLIERAWRRPLNTVEKNTIYGNFVSKTFREGLEISLLSTMLSPRFLFISYDDNTIPRKLNNFEIAERLAFLVTARVPSQRLMNVAKTKDLSNKQILLEEMHYLFDMGNTNRQSDLRRNYAWNFYLELQNQWLELDNLDKVEPYVDVPYNKGALKWANMFFLEEMFRKNRSINQMFTDNFVVVTESIDHLYNVNFSQGVEAEYDIYHTPHSFRKATVPESERKGLLTQAAILAVNAHANTEGEVNPTFRGLWHAGNIICELPQGAPANVALGEDLPVGVSLKEKMSAHMEKGSSCIGCHKIMDPVGFGLWGFDPIGQKREIDTWGFPVDPSGELEGEQFSTATQMIDVISKSEKVETCVMSHITSFVVAHDVDARKSCEAQNILKDVKAKNGGLKDILEQIITSDMFIMRK